MRTLSQCGACALVGIFLGTSAPCPTNAKEDIEFVAEHLPEVAAMDDRYATLPIWNGMTTAPDQSDVQLQTAFSMTTADNLEIRGPLLSIGADWPLTDRWRLGGLVFYDTFELRTDGERRDLQTDFAPSTPIARPVSAEFTNLDGTARDYGGGIYAALQSSGGMLGAHRWIGGVLWHQVVLEDYRLDYRVLEGPDAGATGQIDFDTSYQYVVPFIGFEMPRHYGRWSADAHVLLAYPLRKSSVVGHITGPGFDIHGDTETAGNGVHFGDPSLTLGYTVSYEPLHLSVDLGTLVTQYLLEPRINRGIERNLLLSFSLGF